MAETLTFPDALQVVDPDAMRAPEGYVVEDKGLVEAARTALALGKPLLLTGEAGVGKSDFSRWVAHQLGLGERLKFVVKSTTEARDLFYQFDALARFHDAQAASLHEGGPGGAGAVDVHRYLSYNALGLAILGSMGREKALARGLVSQTNARVLDALPEAPTRAVVLLDEIDKAPRDVPNDILDEIDALAFTVRELENREAAVDPAHRPVVIITSNSERDLPKPFLRRCIYYHMEMPGEDTLARIARGRSGGRFSEALLGESIRVFLHLREEADLRQPPGLAELLDWLAALAAYAETLPAELRRHPRCAETVRAALLKDRHDQQRVAEELDEWLAGALGGPEQGAVSAGG